MIQEKFRDYSINVVLIKYIISVDGGNDEESVLCPAAGVYLT